MYDLEKTYIEKLEALAGEIQDSEELQAYLDSEEEEDYARLKEYYEPKIGLVYDEVAEKKPLQLIALELILLDPAFEGLFLPRILGYSVLRGEHTDNYKYSRPQEHFKEVLLAICLSSNFDILRKRIGQSIQIGFAMSSDIWVTNLINEIDNKKVRYFLQGQKLDKYRREKERAIGFQRFKRQFKNENFQTAEFPENSSALKVLFPSLKQFLIYRVTNKLPNESIIPSLNEFISNEKFQGTSEHLEVLAIYGNFFSLDKQSMAHLNAVFNKMRQEQPGFDEDYLTFLLDLHNDQRIYLDPDADKRMSLLVDRSIDDQLTAYYDITDTIHSKGYLNEEVHEAVKVFYNRYPGRSIINDCLRQTIYHYFHRLIANLDRSAYGDLFEISKQFPVYMEIFANQKFNQGLKVICMAYVRKLLKHYTDKRGKDYQDIKKFVAANFPAFGFLKDKEVVELFKTRRKKKPAQAN